MRAAPYVGVPWKARGDDPAGWDCRGCVRFLRRRIWDLESPGMGNDFYSAVDVRDPEKLEKLLLARLVAWRPVDPTPGAVIVFRVFGRDAHVGLVLTATDFVHSFGGQETTILRLDDPQWSPRIRGCYDTDRQRS